MLHSPTLRSSRWNDVSQTLFLGVFIGKKERRERTVIETVVSPFLFFLRWNVSDRIIEKQK